jgi:SRSO17 transposase
MMTLGQIRRIGKELDAFLGLFRDRFRSLPGFGLGCIYVRGLLSDLGRKTVETIALNFDAKPRTLQRLLESIKWDGPGVRDQCQRLIVQDHAHAEAIGCIDESGTAKSGNHTVGVSRQWLGSCGKVENGVVGVHLSYTAPGFRCLLDSELYLPQEWAEDAKRRKKTTSRKMSPFAPSRRLPCAWWIARWLTEYVFVPGRSMSCTDAIRHSWTVWRNAAKYSWPKCRRISTVG